ncbi:hypothetical protein [Corallococcus exercitus]|uniref:hypothetical protein n=1 Tax=Corallococcus exercitus TaxID=2316736 RepID=UPI001ABFA576|nr:hypothetical protein [Corallococcus exercitus]
MTLVRDGSSWRARIADFDVLAWVEGQKLSVIFPGQGELRGTLAQNGQSISGHWLQPPVLMSGVKFATPVELRTFQPSLWRGTVAPLEDWFSPDLAEAA